MKSEWKVSIVCVCLMLFIPCSTNSTAATFSEFANTTSKTETLKNMLSTLKNLLDDDDIETGYEDIPPYNETSIKCSVHINNITAVKEMTQSFSLDIFLDTSWVDPRLQHENITEEFVVPDRFYKKIWMPDVGFSNGEGGHIHQVTEYNRNLMISANGSMQLTIRVAVELGCPMNFTFYPMDVQICEIQLQSWRYNKDEVDLNWKTSAFTVASGSNISVPQYEVRISTSQTYGYECVETFSGLGRGEYSCLELVFIFKRILKFYAFDIYIPSALIVIISFISVFIDFNIVPARVGIGSLSVSAMTNIIRTFKSTTPPVSYTKAADVWIWACQLFVFTAFMEFGLVNVLNRMFRSKFNKETAEDTFFKRSSPAKTLDKVSRIVFPLLFVLFNIVYWSYYSSVSDFYVDDLVTELVGSIRSLEDNVIAG